MSQAQEHEAQKVLHQIYELLDGAIPSSAEELEEALLADGKKEEWTEEQLKNFKHFCRMMWNT
ncbi:hypothetical protein [Dictyobacter alpinus]|nr:hypothetical protein [Dictyobacter alpinus]